ncbi:hypothetical protein ILP97_31160 [Amycolatopsis sp. H6(2020)]|nr:hypothetical protein [Amycolatopsis sp. H6(2020)]
MSIDVTHNGRAADATIDRHLGMPDTTFRRRYPALCAELAAATSACVPDAGSIPSTGGQREDSENARLRANNRDLRARLDGATAVIQRLSLEKQTLQDQLHAARNVTVITPGR